MINRSQINKLLTICFFVKYKFYNVFLIPFYKAKVINLNLLTILLHKLGKIDSVMSNSPLSVVILFNLGHVIRLIAF